MLVLGAAEWHLRTEQDLGRYTQAMEELLGLLQDKARFQRPAPACNPCAAAAAAAVLAEGRHPTLHRRARSLGVPAAQPSAAACA